MGETSIVVFGARCTWWDYITRAGSLPSGLPCCPHCGSPLFQDHEDSWWAGVDRYEADGHPGYRDVITWAQGRCFPQGDRSPMEVLFEAYREATYG